MAETRPPSPPNPAPLTGPRPLGPAASRTGPPVPKLPYEIRWGDPGCLVALNEPCTPAGPGKTSCCFTVQAPAWVLIGLASIKAPNT